MPRIDNINITNGQIAYSNFSGRPTPWVPEGGVKTVTFVIPEDISDDLKASGWNIRRQEFEDGSFRHLLECKIKYKTRDGKPRDPKIFVVRNDSLVHMTEDTVETLDRADIVSVDAVIGPSHYDWGGKTGISAYINSMYVTIRENPIDEKYRKMIDQMNESVISTDELSLPFPVE